MSLQELKTVIRETNKHSELAKAALKEGRHAESQYQMEKVTHLNQQYCLGLADEAPGEQQDDNEAEDTADDKGCVAEKPHSEHCVPSDIKKNPGHQDT